MRNLSAQAASLTTPACEFDVPGLSQDFYTNVVDWSSRDVVAIGIENSVCLMRPKAKTS